MSSSLDRELEEQLLDAGNRLVDPPSSDDELLPLLDQVENCLSRVEQSPTQSMHDALSPSLRALVADQLLKHPNADVKVAVASCISEITRITAPDAPYDDDRMKEVFQVIVSSFDNLSDKSSRSYAKRASILETVAKVRSCVVMLDLECDALILEMFEHFLKTIRDHHPDNVFTSMETIMTLVLKESEDISPELLSPILASVKKDNEEILPIARKLGERVLESCASKVKPYLIQAVKSLGISLDDYSPVVASLCQQETLSAFEQGDDHVTAEQMAEENNLEKVSLEDSAQVDKEITTKEVPAEHVEPAIEKSPKSAVSNGVTQTGEDASLLDSDSKQEDDHHGDQSKSTNSLSNAEPVNMETDKVECKVEQTPKRRGRKPSSSKSQEPSDGSQAEGEKEAEELLDNHKINSKDDVSSPCVEPSSEAAIPSVHEKDTKVLESEVGSIASPSPSVDLPEEGRPRKVGRPKKKETLTKDSTPSADVVSKESKQASEGTSDPEVKPTKRPGNKPAAGVSNEDTSPATFASKKESGTASDSEVKASKQSAKKVETTGDNVDGSLKHPEDKKKRGRTKTVIEKDATKSSTKDDNKEAVSSPKSNTKSTKNENQLEETPQTSSKRKRTPVVEQASGAKDGEDLVGLKIEVWWPKDRTYYEGVVDSYDSVKKRHKVSYIDGDEEVLNLKKQKWRLVESDKGEGADESSPDASSDVPQKKKAKTNSDLSATKQGKLDASSKRGGGSSSSKAKGSAAKPGRKSGDAGRVDVKSKGEVLKKSDDDSGSKSKVQTPKGGSKSVNLSKAAANKSKDDDTGTAKSSKTKDVEITPKTSSKTKQDTPKTKSKPDTPKAVNKSKGKTPKGGGKSSANGNSKVKSGASKAKEESEDVEEASSDESTEEAPESVKGKSPEPSKAQGSEAKTTGKKRRRGARS